MLALQQQWLWGLSRAHGKWSDTLTYALRLTGALHYDALQKSLEAVVNRHDALRARIVESTGEFVQQVAAPLRYSLEISTVTYTEQQIRELAARSIELTTQPLFQTKLIRCSNTEHILIIRLHRLIADCPSFDRVLREVWDLYGAFIHGASSPLTERAMGYDEYAQWQHAKAHEWQQKHAPYWNQRLTNASRIRWPVDKQATRHAGPTLVAMDHAFDAALSTSLLTLSRQAKALPALLLLTAYAAAVSRFCMQQDFVVPFDIAGRHSEHGPVVGNFSYPLYLRMVLSRRDTFSDLLRRVSSEFYRAVAHQDYGHVAMLHPELLSGTLFQWQARSPRELLPSDAHDLAARSGLQLENIPFQNPAALTTLPSNVVTLETSFYETPSGIRVLVLYRADLFSADTINRFLELVHWAAERMTLAPHLWVLARDDTQSEISYAEQA